MPKKQKEKEEPGLHSPGVIVTHPENHISPRNRETLWLVAMMAMIGFVAGICTILLWQRDEIGWQFDRMHLTDNGAAIKKWSRDYRDMAYKMSEPKESKVDFSYLVLENFDLYQKVDGNIGGFPVCSSAVSNPTQEMKAFDAAMKDILESQEVYALPLPGKTLFYTPRMGITNEMLKSLQSCGEVGTLFPIDITHTDKIIWGNLSCGGVEVTPEDGAEVYAGYQRCLKTTEALNEIFVNS